MRIANIGVSATTGITLNQTQDTLTVSTISIGTVGSTGTYNYSGGTLNAGAITLNTGGTFTGSADLTLNALHFAGGQTSGAGETTVPVGGVLNFLGSVNAQIHRTIINQGTATWDGIGSFTGSGSIVNEGAFNIINNGDSGPAAALSSFVVAFRWRRRARRGDPPHATFGRLGHLEAC